MEQSNNFNNPGGGKGPKMPRFNMNWLYTIILIALIALFFSGGGDALGGSAAKEATYTEFKQYVDKGYVLSVVANKTESTRPVTVCAMIFEPPVVTSVKAMPRPSAFHAPSH